MSATLRPLSIVQAIPFFGIPLLLELVLLLWLLPELQRAGWPPILLFALWGLPLALMLVAASVAHRLEGGALGWTAIRDRLRLGPMRRRGWLWSVGLALFHIASYIGMAYAVEPLLKYFPSSPAIVGAILGSEKVFVGFPMKGAWWLLGVWFVFYLFNILGEELWWRGYVLPRQELAHGRWAWAIHGVFWTLFHAFYSIEALMILPGALALAFVCQREKSTWPGIVSHGFLNALASIRIVIGILG